MKSNMWKSTFREIKQSFGRFMAIFAITALGVSLFSGLKVIQPAMVKTTDEYFKEKSFYNYRLLSTLGYEEEDVEYLAAQEDVRSIEGAVSFDILCSVDGESPRVIKAYNLPEQINEIELLYGRIPENAQECIVDSAVYGEDSIGKKLYLSEDNTEDDLENFAYTEFTIVGVAQSPNYIQFERGNTSLGNGKITGFMYLPMEAFDVDFFTEILVKFDEDYTIYSDEYENYMDEKEPVWEELAQEAADNRYDTVLVEATEELEDAKKEFAEEKADAEADLEEARLELADAFEELSDAEKELTDGKQELADGRAELEENRKTLQAAESKIGYNEKALEEAEKELEDNYDILCANSAELEDGKAQLEAGQSELDKQKAPLVEARAQIDSLKENVSSLETQLLQLEQGIAAGMVPEQQQVIAVQTLEGYVNAILQQLQPGTASDDMSQLDVTTRIAALKAKIQAINSAVATQEAQLAQGETQIAAAQAEIDKNRAEIQAGEAQISAASSQIEAGRREIADGKKQLEDGKQELAEGWAKFYEGEAELLEGEAELADAEQELADGWAEYYDGLEEYEEGYQEFLTEIADAEEEIADAEEELADLEKPETYVLGRETNVGYVCLENDSAIVDGIANVFPVFFYAVAALVCITTMNRMIEEQRTQIGVLKALGYSEASIMGKYLFYSGSAAITGCLFGYFFGTWFFPIVIWFAYSTMYDVADILYVFDAGVLIFSLVVSILCSMGVTFISCKNELAEVAAELMRPKAPKVGKRIFLEYIPFIWKPMKFLHKVSYRNVFRYKKRFFMMVIGISGCTGLLVTGFGVQDSIANIANDQYDRIQVVDVNVMLADEVTADTDALIEKITGDRVTDYIYVMEKSIDLVTDDAVKSLSLVAIDETEDISPYVVLPDAETGEVLQYPKEGECILTDKLANTYDLQVGDTVVFRDENNHTMELKLSGIAENYLYNFVYMTTQTYESYLGEDAEVKSVYMNLAEGVDPHQMTADLMKEDEVASASVSSDSKNRFSNMIESLDLLIVVIIICAGFLAFIVLYNLTNINITERIREIATIKVLGFYKSETASYVFRENLILTAFGAVAGLGLGKLFHAFVMSQVQVDQVSFNVQVLPRSYIYSVILTFVFAAVINLFMTGKLERVSMTESLKSVD
ncbi:MAG: FtsX-like permease family protein [Lachnospiraceae bacterium]|nr:FtsX-like permease family protein [Lachnospiraceae bacterium]